MLFQKETNQVGAVIKAYQPGMIKLNIGEFESPVLLIEGEKHDYQGPEDFKALTAEIILQMLKDKPEIMIIGSGPKHQFLAPKTTQMINQQGIAIETMASREACHTYQVLTFEQRRICALIFP
jgi:uncharacterized protein